MHLSSDEIVFWQYGVIKLNETIVTTWVLMLVLALGAKLMTRRLSSGVMVSSWQSALEIVVSTVKSQMASVGLAPREFHLTFIGTLFVFLASANLATILPFYEPPTGSLSTTAGLAIWVFLAVPLFGITEIRQHDERCRDPGHTAHHHPAFISHSHDCPGSFDRHGPGLYL